jgi:hypothetical protein
VIGVKLCDCIGKDRLDLLSRDLVLDEVARVYQCGNYVSEILFASMLAHQPQASISNDGEQPCGNRGSTAKFPDGTSRSPECLLNGVLGILRRFAEAQPVPKDDLPVRR